MVPEQSPFDGSPIPVELYDVDVPRVDAVRGPATGVPFLIMKSASPNTTSLGAVAMPQDPSIPLPIAITDLLSQLTILWTEWEAGGTTPATPDQTTFDPDSSDVEKGQDARWARMLRRVSPATQTDIRTTVAMKALSLAASMNIPTADAVAIVKGLVCDKMPPPRVRSVQAVADGLSASYSRQAFLEGQAAESRRAAKQRLTGR